MPLNSLDATGFYEFGPFVLDVAGRVLSRGDVPVPLAPKSFDLLVHLVRNAGRAVPREELLAAVWPDVVVSDGTLTQAVFVVRRALGEGEEGRLLETVPRVGYRFSRDVRAASGPARREGGADPIGGGAEASPPAVPAAGRTAGGVAGISRRLLAAGVLLAAIAATAGLGWRRARRAPAEDGRHEARPGALLALAREIAVPPDASELLGRTGDTVVLGAPGALYLVPSDGAQPATRVPLAAGEVTADRLAAGELLVAKGRALAFRDPLTRKERALGGLPAGTEAPRAARFLVSPAGAFAAVRSLGAVEVLALAGGVARVLRVPLPESENEALALSDRFFALAPGGGRAVRAWALPSGAPVLEAPLEETRVRALALEDASERLAAGGAFDTVALFSLAGGAPERFPARGWTRGLAFVPDHPTLVASGRLGLFAARPAAGVVEAHEGLVAAGVVRATADGLLVLSPERQRLALVAYRGFPPLATVPASRAPLWAVDHADGTLYAGGRDGRLYALDAGRLALRSESVHTDGIPALLAAGGLLASSSDDKTVAVWSLPGPKLVSRTRAHAFLVNGLALAPKAPGGSRLFTASSDGTLKAWSWPAMEARETVDLAALAGEKVEAHALWSAEDGTRLLAGTWNHRLLDLAPGGGGWTVRSLPVVSRATYCLAPLPSLGAVGVVGLYPHDVSLFDLASGRLVPLGSADLDAFWAASDAAGRELFVVGAGGASRYRIDRVDGAGWRVRLWSRRQSGLDLLAAARTSGGELWAGTQQGTIVKLDAASLEGPPLSDRTLK